MLNRLSASALLKSVIIVMAAAVVAVLSVGAKDSWQRLGAASRVSAIADASASTFKAMHNLRTDGSTTARILGAAPSIAPELERFLKGIRDAEVPALRSAASLLPGIEFAGRAALVSELNQELDRLNALQTETLEALRQPKKARRATLAKDHAEVTDALLTNLDKISINLVAAINHDDPLIDQLLSIKQAAWLLRSAAGEASDLISTGLMSTGSTTLEAQTAYTKLVGGIDATWRGLQSAAWGMQLSSDLAAAMAAAKTAYFDPKYTGLRDRLMDAVAVGSGTEITADQWTPLTAEHLGSAVAVAERALDEARSHAAVQHSAAERALVVQLALLICALGLAAGSVALVNRRVIRPLQAIRDAMLKVAAGNLAVDAGDPARDDEIGALVAALKTFKQQAAEKARIEQQERERNADTASRQRAIEACIGEFDSQVRQTLSQLGSASNAMRSTSDGLAAVSSKTNASVEIAARASDEASSNVQSVASASEQLSASIADISRQASHAAGIARRAVNRARETDGTVQGLAVTANKIGEVIGLINDIASQTNLLALNATIEAARAGDAGRGFAVVAAEVKSLASQTAKATEEISEQIADIQKVAGAAIDAIQGIGAIIGEVNEVATAIAAAVEQQGAATQEITRSTQQAAQGTRNVSDSIGGVSAGADAAGTVAQDVRTASQTLDQQTQHLRGQVDDFLGKIRAA